MKRIDWKVEKKFLITVAILLLTSGLLISGIIGAKNVPSEPFGEHSHRETLHPYTAQLGIVNALFTPLAVVTQIYEKWL